MSEIVDESNNLLTAIRADLSKMIKRSVGNIHRDVKEKTGLTEATFYYRLNKMPVEKLSKWLNELEKSNYK